MPKIDITRTELVWPGKYNEDGTRKEVPRVSLPFQVIETVNESRATREAKRGGIQETLFDVWEGKEGDTFEDGWKNKLIWGDNLLVMGSLLEKFAGKIDLIYIDPPFATGANFAFTTDIGDSDLEVTKEQSAIEEKAYRDTWDRGTDSFIAMIYQRLVLMRDLLAEDGSIYLHCDWRLNSVLRLVMDEVFTKENFRNEIAWCYLVNKGNFLNKYPPRHDTILFYAKSAKNYFDSEATRMQPSEATVKRWGAYANEKGEVPFEKLTPGMKKVAGKGEKPYLLRGGVQVDWISKIPGLNSGASTEIVGYPTQKPEELIEFF